MFDNMAKQVMHDAETYASNDGEYVRLHHLTRALLTGQGISNTVLKSLGMTKENVPHDGVETKQFVHPWRNGNDDMYIAYYTPEVVAVWYEAQCLQTQTGRSDATEFFLIGLMLAGGEYFDRLRKTFNFTTSQVYSRIEHLQAVSLWSGFEPEAHARRLLSLAQAAVTDSNFDEALRLVKLAIQEIRQAKHSGDHRLLMSRAQTVKQASRFYKSIAQHCPSGGYARRAQRYEKLAAALSADVLKREQDNWEANQLGFQY